MKASEVFDKVCGLIASNYSERGWKYSKSSHWMTKKDKKYTYKVFFYTSWNNISDKNVAFYSEFAIINSNSKRKIFHLDTRQCKIPEGQLYWNIANEQQQHSTIYECKKWLDETCIPIVENCINNPDQFVKQVVAEGFYPSLGYIVDIDFVLNEGSRELAEEAAKKYYDHLKASVQKEFRDNYMSMMADEDAVSTYGNNMMRNPSNFRTIIENKINIDF